MSPPQYSNLNTVNIALLEHTEVSVTPAPPLPVLAPGKPANASGLLASPDSLKRLTDENILFIGFANPRGTQPNFRKETTLLDF